LGSGEQQAEGVKTPNSLKGIGLTLIAMAVLPYIDVCAKFLGQQNLHIAQIVWARVFFGMVLTLPFALRTDGKHAFVPKPPGLQLIRGLVILLATFFFFTGLRYMPIADAMAIFYVQPLMVVLLSAIILKEMIDAQRIVAVIVGFIAILIIIRPGFGTMNAGVIYPLCAGLCFAIYVIVTRKIAGQSNAITTTFQTSAIGAVIVTAIMPFVWVAPTLEQWVLMVLMAFFGVSGHFLVTKAYDYAEASLLAPLAYIEILMSILAGWIFFSDLPDRYTLLGVAILIACALYISWRERALANEAPTSL
jgi:drug/metabolite transporter (DMT)-like permease